MRVFTTTTRTLRITWAIFCFIMFIYGVCALTSLLAKGVRSLFAPENDPVPISYNIGKKYVRGGKMVRLVDLSSGRNLSPRFRWVVTPEKRSGDSIAVFCTRNGKRGYLDINSGKTTLRAKYSKAFIFSDSLAAVVGKDRKVGFIRPDGTFAIEPKFPFIEGHDYVFKNGYCWIMTPEDLYGVIDKSGEWVLEPRFNYVSDYATNAFVVGENCKFGLLDQDLNWIYEPVHEDIRIADEDKKTVFVTDGGIKKLMTYDGTVLEPFIVDSAGALYPETDSEGDYSPARFNWFLSGEGMGVMDALTGKMIIPPLYDDVEMISENLFFCSFDHYYGPGVIYDCNGNPLSENLAREAAEAFAKNTYNQLTIKR